MTNLPQQIDTKVTAVIIAHNEEAKIKEAIISASILANTVIVIDDRSSDNTSRIATELGASVIPALEENYGNPELLFRQGFLTVESGWILRMDADERLTLQLANELRSITFSKNSSISAARYARKNYMFGDFVKHGGWLKPQQIGFFRSNSWDPEWGQIIHQQITILGKVHTVPPHKGVMEHLDYYSIEEFITRGLLKYAKTEATQLFRDGITFSKRKMLFGSVRRLYGRYFIRQGYRDGMRGLILAGLLTAYDIATWSYLWELEKNSKN